MRQVAYKNRRSHCKDNKHSYYTKYNQIKSNKNKIKFKDKPRNLLRIINRKYRSNKGYKLINNISIRSIAEIRVEILIHFLWIKTMAG